MDNKKAPSPFAVLWGWASGEHGGFYASVALAVLGVGMMMLGRQISDLFQLVKSLFGL